MCSFNCSTCKHKVSSAKARLVISEECPNQTDCHTGQQSSLIFRDNAKLSMFVTKITHIVFRVQLSPSIILICKLLPNHIINERIQQIMHCNLAFNNINVTLDFCIIFSNNDVKYTLSHFVQLLFYVIFLYICSSHPPFCQLNTHRKIINNHQSSAVCQYLLLSSVFV